MGVRSLKVTASHLSSAGCCYGGRQIRSKDGWRVGTREHEGGREGGREGARGGREEAMMIGRERASVEEGRVEGGMVAEGNEGGRDGPRHGRREGKREGGSERRRD